MFFTFSQNNSGGSFDGTTYIIIEADSAAEANDRAVNETPIYFDGCTKGMDCSCCGDRWSEAWSDSEGEPVPSIYSEDMSLAITDRDQYVKDHPDRLASSFFGRDFDIYYKDGRTVEVRFTEDDKSTAKSLKQAKTPTVWGFRFYTGWDQPTDVFQAFQSDYDKTAFWHENGNDEIQLSAPGKYGYNVETSDVWGDNLMISFSAQTEDEANKAYAEFMGAIQEVIDIKVKAAKDMEKKIKAVTGVKPKSHRSGL